MLDPTTPRPAAAAPTDGVSLIRTLLAGDLRTPEEVRDAVDFFHGDVRLKMGRFWLQLVLATTIATAGVLGNSTATVIGAMIIAPLGSPIQGVARGLAAGDLASLLKSAGLVTAAAVVVIALGALLGFVLPELIAQEQNPQITGRTSPTVIDLVAASATGAIGAFALARRDIGDVLPGVAIAISLVPPLAVVGISLDHGDFEAASGAFLLFATNVLAIIVIGGFVLRLLGVAVEEHARAAGHRRRALAVIGVGSLVVVSALTATTTHTVRLHRWADGALGVAGVWAVNRGDEVVASRFDGEDLVIEIQGPVEPVPADLEDLRLRLRAVVPAGTPVVLRRVSGSRQDVGIVPGVNTP